MGLSAKAIKASSVNVPTKFKESHKQMNMVIYARFSSHAQNEQSIEGQLRVCKEYAERNGYVILDEYIDRATTGTNDQRANFQQMIEDAEKKQFQYILVYKLDRFARNKYDSVIHKHNLGKSGVKVISATEAISDSPEGKLLEGLLEMMAEMYSEDLSQKVKRGLKESRLKGNFVGGSILYGYKVIDKKPIIDEEKAEAVRYLFTEYAAGKPKKQIVSEINEKGYRTNKGKPFTFNSLQCCLSNQKYLGIDMANGIVNETRYPAIITQEVFDEVQKRLRINKKRPAAQKAKVNYLLSGKVFCGICGASMFGVSGTSYTKKPHRYYACCNRYNKKTCVKKHERKDELEYSIVAQTTTYILKPDKLDLIAGRMVKEFENNINAQRVKDYEKRIAKVNADLDKCFELFFSAENDELKKRLNERAKDLELTKKDLNTELAKLRYAAKMKHTKADIVTRIQEFCQGDESDEVYRKRIIDAFVSCIFVFDDGRKATFYNLFDSFQPSYVEMLDYLPEAESIDNAPKVRILGGVVNHNKTRSSVIRYSVFCYLCRCGSLLLYHGLCDGGGVPYGLCGVSSFLRIPMIIITIEKMPAIMVMKSSAPGVAPIERPTIIKTIISAKPMPSKTSNVMAMGVDRHLMHKTMPNTIIATASNSKKIVRILGSAATML